MKNTFLNEMQTKLDNVDSKLAVLAKEAEAKGLDASAKAEYEKHMGSLKARKAELKAKLSEVQNASDGAWPAIKHEAEVVYDDLVSYMDKVYSQYGSETGLY